MPSGRNYKRDYRQERKTAKRRGETGVGSKSGDAARHRARRRALKKTKNKSGVQGKDLHHTQPLARGGANSRTRFISRRSNRSHGGRIGSRSGKAAGAKKGHKNRG